MQTAPTTSTDPILETQVFWNRHKMPILIGLVVVLCVGAAYGAYQLYVTHRGNAAATALAQANGPEDFQKVIANYPSTGAGASAALLLAGQQREKQQYAEANGTLEKFIKAHPKHEFVSTARMAMAGNLDAMGKTDQALEMYRKIAANDAQSYNAPLAMIAQAQLLKGMGKLDEARQVCETVMTQYRDSYATLEATQMLKTLKTAGVETPVPLQAAPAAVSSPAAPMASAAAASPAASVAATP